MAVRVFVVATSPRKARRLAPTGLRFAAPFPCACPKVLSQALSGEFVVLVEDDDALRHALSFELEAAGYRVEAYETGEEALSATATCPALAILDYRLPGIDGLDLLRELRVRYPQLRAMVISSDCAESQIPSGPGLPRVRLIRKPFAKSAFMTGVASLVG